MARSKDPAAWWAIMTEEEKANLGALFELSRKLRKKYGLPARKATQSVGDSK